MRQFNLDFVIPRHFKMEGLHTVRQMLCPLDYLTVIDLKAAYPSMGIAPRYRDYFIFRFRDQFYRYRGTVFGVSSLPRAWTKLLRPFCAFLRSFGIRLVIFLDDLLVMSASFAQCAQDTQDVVTVLTWLGFIISTKEQVKLVPEQRQVWCGVLICSLTMQFLLPPEKMKAVRVKMRRQLRLCSAHAPLTLRQWSSVLGTMRACTVAVLPALLWSQGIRRFVSKYVTRDIRCWNQVLPSPPLEVLDNLRRFTSREFSQHNGRPIRPLPADLLTDSDASGFGGGMVSRLDDRSEARWHWLPEEAKLHINWKELVTHLRGLQALDLETPGLVLNSTIFNQCDNSVSVSYVNRQGGRVPELSFAAEALWYWLLARGSSIRDIFLPGVQNVRADSASRWYIDFQEYQLQPTLFRRLNAAWGPFTIDAFASRANAQMRPFWSRWSDPDSDSAPDAIVKDWRPHNLWLNPLTQ